MSKLTAHDRTIKTPFGLLGTNENSLTFALGYLYHICPEFLRKTLYRLNIKRIHKSHFKDIEIILQKNRVASKHGITDVEIRLPGKFHVVIEAKIGLDVPTLNQCELYLPELDEPVKCLAVLQNAEYVDWVKRYKKENPKFEGVLCGLYWAELLQDAIYLLKEYSEETIEGYWLRKFVEYIKEEYYMGSYTHEVWIVPTSKKELWPGGMSFYDIHTIPNQATGKRIYFWQKNKFATRKPLYIAFRSRGFDTVHRVLEIKHDSVPIEDVPELINISENWPKEPATIWYVGEPINLGRKIDTGTVVGPAHVTCDFDLLLTCDSVAEIREKMKERKSIREG